MSPITLLSAAFASFALIATPLAAIEITLPVETAQLKQSPLPGYALAASLCVTCHSVDYVETQPVSSRAWWKSSVTKMQKTFGAPIPDEAVEPLVDYLVKTYGAERRAASARTDSTNKSASARSSTGASTGK